MPATARRKIGTEPAEVDLLVGPTTLTAADRRELDVFFREQRQRNDKSPAVRAIRKQLAERKTQAHARALSTPPLPGTWTAVNPKRGSTPSRYAAAKKAVPAAAARKAAPAKKKK